jgi:hypothetical protein
LPTEVKMQLRSTCAPRLSVVRRSGDCLGTHTGARRTVRRLTAAHRAGCELDLATQTRLSVVTTRLGELVADGRATDGASCTSLPIGTAIDPRVLAHPPRPRTLDDVERGAARLVTDGRAGIHDCGGPTPGYTSCARNVRDTRRASGHDPYALILTFKRHWPRSSRLPRLRAQITLTSRALPGVAAHFTLGRRLAPLAVHLAPHPVLPGRAGYTDRAQRYRVNTP